MYCAKDDTHALWKYLDFTAMGTDANIVRLTRVDDLRAILVNRKPPRRVTLELQSLASPPNDIERQLNRLLSACGCGEATAAMLTTFTVSVSFAIFVLDQWSWIERLLLVFVATGVAMVVAKLIARALARRRFFALLQRLIHSIEE